MSDLATTAQEAAVKGEQADQLIEEQKTRLDQLRELLNSTLATMTEHVDESTEWVQKISTRAEESTTMLRDDAAVAVSGAIADLMERMETAISEGDAIAEQTRVQIEALEVRATELTPDAETLLDTVKKTVDTLGDEVQGLRNALEETRAEADAFLQGEFNETMRLLTEETEAESSRIGAYVSDDFVPTIVDETTQFVQHIGEVVQKLTTKVAEISQFVEQDATEILNQLSGGMIDRVQQVIDTFQRVKELMERTSALMEDTVETTAEVMNTMNQAVALTSIGVTSIIGIFRELEEMFSRVG